jgi:hypothetical protein
MGLVKQGYGVGNAPSNRTVISTTVGVFDDDGFEIGFIQSIDRSDSRPTQKVRHLNKADAGRIIEQQPGVEDVTVNVNGWALYQKSDSDKQSLLNRLPTGAGAFVSLNQQSIPFNIREEETHPATGAENVTLYLGCMLTSYSKPININTASIVERATVAVSYIE